MGSPYLDEITTTTQRNRSMSDSDGKYGVGECTPPKNAPPGPSGPALIPTAPTKENTGYVRGGVKNGKLRDSGHSGAHRIGRK